MLGSCEGVTGKLCYEKKEG